MYCTACGCEFADTCVFCPRCGAMAPETDHKIVADSPPARQQRTFTPSHPHEDEANERRSSRICIASLILGLVSAICFVTSFFAWVPLIGGPGYGVFISLLTVVATVILAPIGLSTDGSRRKLALIAMCLSFGVIAAFVARFLWMAVNSR